LCILQLSPVAKWLSRDALQRRDAMFVLCCGVDGTFADCRQSIGSTNAEDCGSKRSQLHGSGGRARVLSAGRFSRQHGSVEARQVGETSRQATPT